VLTLILLMLALRLAWGWYSYRLLAAQLDEARRRGEPVAAEDIVFESVPDSENAFLVQVRAAQSQAAGVDSPRNSIDEYPHDYPPFPANWMKRAKASEQAHGKVFALARQARQLSGVQIHDRLPIPWTPSSAGYLTNLRYLANTLTDGALYAHVTGDDSEALERIFDVLHLSRSLRRDPVLVSQLVAMGFDALAFDTVQTIAPGLELTAEKAAKPATRRQIQQLIFELLDESEAWKGFQASLLAERAWIAEVRRSNSQGTWFIRPLATMDAIRSHRNLDLVIEASHLPNNPQARAMLARCLIEKPLNDPFASLFGSTPSKSQVPRYSRWFVTWGDLSRTFETHFRALAERRMSAVALAVRLYRIEHDRFPEHLQDLVPQYLPAVPDDPFLEGKPLGYVVLKAALPDGSDRPMIFYEAGDGFALPPMKRPVYSFSQNPTPGDHRPMRQYHDVTRFEPSSP
jgi:hypothetical protein